MGMAATSNGTNSQPDLYRCVLSAMNGIINMSNVFINKKHTLIFVSNECLTSIFHKIHSQKKFSAIYTTFEIALK